MKRYTIILMLQIIVCSASAQNSAFDELRKHLQSQGDTLKLKALSFLENNIDIHASRTYFWEDSVEVRVNLDEKDFPNFNEYRKALKQLRTERKIKPVPLTIADRELLTAEMLRENIDRAFEAWGKPWNKQLSFDDFCDYLLPYRVQDEPLENWNKNYYKKFIPLAKNTAADICNNVNSNLKTWFFSSFAFEDRTELDYCLSPSQLLLREQGNCQDLCNLSVYAMRTLGLASGIDFTPAWATSSYSHWWCTYIDEQNRHRPFEGVTGTADDFVVFREPSKVFRITYRNQPDALANRIPATEIPNGHLRMKNITDVTHQYWRTTSITCHINKTTENGITYIGVFNALNWKPVDWAEAKDNKAAFQNLSVGAVYIPLNYKNGKVNPAGNPILINSDKSTKELAPNYGHKITVTITEAPKYLIYRLGKKYAFFYWDGKWINVGTKTADETKVLSFENVPANTLYLLVPEYSERKERIFTVSEKGEIERW